jgi:hypothetical protein
MLAFHPIIQLLAISLFLYVFFLGIQRFRSLYLHKKTAFKWKRHVVLGEIALGTLFLGLLGGMTMVYLYWRGFFITGGHGKVALVMAPLILFGFASGVYMNIKKKQRRILPLLHGINNLVVLILALTQAYSGWWVYRTFVLGE